MNSTDTNIRKKAMIEALEKSLGIVTTAAKAAGIDRSTHYDWLKDDEDYRKAVDSIQDIALDFAESKLHKQIENGEVSSTIFYLKTKGKKRGYVERQELTGEDGGPIKTSFTFAKSNDYTLIGTPSEPKPVTKYEDAFKMNVSYFEKTVTFQQKIKLKAGNLTAIKGQLEYMTCNDRKCLPPEDVDFTIPLK